MTATTSRAPLLIPKTLVARLLRLYDVPHPAAPDRLIRGYDRPHAVRTARMCAAVAAALSTEGYGAVEPIPHRARVLQAAGAVLARYSWTECARRTLHALVSV